MSIHSSSIDTIALGFVGAVNLIDAHSLVSKNKVETIDQKISSHSCRCFDVVSVVSSCVSVLALLSLSLVKHFFVSLNPLASSVLVAVSLVFGLVAQIFTSAKNLEKDSLVENLISDSGFQMLANDKDFLGVQKRSYSIKSLLISNFMNMAYLVISLVGLLFSFPGSVLSLNLLLGAGLFFGLVSAYLDITTKKHQSLIEINEARNVNLLLKV